MFELLNPLYFYIGGALGVVIPLVLHLIQRSRTVRIPFSTLRFLRMAHKKSSSRLKIEHLLLWLLRTLLLVVLSIAFSMLMLRNKSFGDWFGKAARDVAIVVDGSYSMEYNLGRKTAWQDAVDCAVAAIEGLTERDRFCVFVAGDHVTPVIEQLTGNREEGINRLKSLKPAMGSSQLAPAIMEAYAVLAEVKERREREIFVISDSQALPWRDFGPADGKPAEAKPAEAKPADPKAAVAKAADPKAAKDSKTPAGDSKEEKKTAAMGVWDPTKITDQTVCFVSLLGAPSPENIAVTDVALDPPLIMKDFASKATIKVRASGVPKTTAATLFVGDKEVARQAVTIEASLAGEATFIVPPLSPGRHAARVQLPDDNLMTDNTFNFVIKAEDQFPTVCIGTREDTLFARAALTAGLGSKGTSEAEWLDASKLAEKDLQAYACAFLCNAIPIGAEEMTALERFVDGGGLLVVFPGDRASPSDYQAWSCLPGIPVSAETVPLAARRQTLSWDKPNHPILNPLKVGDVALTTTVKKRLVWNELEKDAERLISSGGDHALLVGRPRGRGYVLMFAVSADRTWGDFPLSPFYLPILQQIVQFGAGVGSYAHYAWCTELLPLAAYLPEATRESAVLDPDGEVVPLRSVTDNGQTSLCLENATKPGIYRIRDSGDSEARPAFATNVRREESDLAPVNPADIETKMGLKHVYVSHDRDELLKQVQESRIGRTFAEELLWLVLILAVAEFFYANLLLKNAPSLSEKLEIESSGRIVAEN